MSGLGNGSLGESLNNWLETSEFLSHLQDKTRINRKLLFLITVLCILFVLSLQAGRNFIMNLIAFVLPVYQSYKALKTDDPETHKRCLSYWVVLGTVSIVESVFYSLLHYIPFYRLAKGSFLFYCFLPSTNGAQNVLDQVLGPLLTPYESTLDVQMSRITSIDTSQLPQFPDLSQIPRPHLPQFPNFREIPSMSEISRQDFINYYRDLYGIDLFEQRARMATQTQRQTININTGAAATIRNNNNNNGIHHSSVSVSSIDPNDNSNSNNSNGIGIVSPNLLNNLGNNQQNIGNIANIPNVANVENIPNFVNRNIAQAARTATTTTNRGSPLGLNHNGPSLLSTPSVANTFTSDQAGQATTTTTTGTSQTTLESRDSNENLMIFGSDNDGNSQRSKSESALRRRINCIVDNGNAGATQKIANAYGLNKYDNNVLRKDNDHMENNSMKIRRKSSVNSNASNTSHTTHTSHDSNDDNYNNESNESLSNDAQRKASSQDISNNPLRDAATIVQG